MHLIATLQDLLVTQAESAPAKGGAMDGIITFIGPLLMIVVIWLFLFRPASKQRREHAAMLNSLKKDDEVVTSGGVLGKIISLDDKLVTLEIADKVKIRILRDRVTGRWNPSSNPSSQKT
jgi:preprotein translocase subunit YajC